MPTPDILVAEESPLTAQYGPIEFVPDPKQKCPAPGVSGKCEVNSLHPAPAGQRWVQYISRKPLKPAQGDSTLEGNVVLSWSDPETCSNFAGKPYAIWVSDTSDTLNGNTVKDGYFEGVDGANGCAIGSAGPSGTSAGALAAAAAAIVAFARRRKRATPQ